MNVIIDKCRFIFEILRDNGFECYAVGGCVRDYLLGRESKDIDFTTNAKPDEIIACFKSFKLIEIGKKYGTIGVIKDLQVYEVTTYRVDGSYKDSRHPDGVNFSSSVEEDLSRRDFTINAMAMDEQGNIIDIFGSESDLNNKIIRTVGDARQRFTEDALRIVRALRFSAALGFALEKTTSDSCHLLKDTLNRVHPQRLRDELVEIILSSNASEILKDYRDVFAVIIPHLKDTFGFQQITAHHRYDVFNHTLKAIKVSEPILELRLALLFHDIAKPMCAYSDKAGITHFKGHPEKSAEIAKSVLTTFGFSKKLADKVEKLVKYHDVRFEKPKLHIKKLLSELSEDEFISLLKIQRCDILAQSEYKREDKLKRIDYIREVFEDIIESKACVKIYDLAVNGNDIVALSARGPMIGCVLEFLLDEVIHDRVSNEYEPLMESARNYLSRS